MGTAAQQSAGETGSPSLSLPRTGQISTFDNAGNRIDYLGSFQDGELQRGEVWPEPRFLANADGTVTDALTGLMWLKDGNCFGKLSWSAALKKVQDLNGSNAGCLDYGGKYNDWLLPDLNELATLINAEEALPVDYLKLQGIANAQPGSYWSSTIAVNLFKAWIVDFSNGNIRSQSKITQHFIMPVRKAAAGKIEILPISSDSLPGQDENRGISALSGGRFFDNGDGTVTDRWTGLMWLQDSSCLEAGDWMASVQAVAALNTSASRCAKYSHTYSDWSLPNRIELRSLIDYTRDYPALSDGASFAQNHLWGWSATSSVASPEMSFAINFDMGDLLARPKKEKLWPMAVRRTQQAPLPPRKESVRADANNLETQFMLNLAPELRREINWPPEPRFIENGDGTSLDIITGKNWLTDGNCFGRLSWKEISATLRQFNRDARGYECLGYESTYDDWQVPSLEEMKELLNDKKKDSAAWLNTQGVKNVQSSSDYWTSSETLFNLYFAYIVNFKHGTINTYPKTFGFFLWPKRSTKQEIGREPLLELTINGLSNALSLSSEAPMSLVLYLHTFELRLPADFWLWYDTPDNKQIWLSPVRMWKDSMLPIYQGDLFNLRDYEVYKSSSNELAPGEYTFHFAIDMQQDGILGEKRKESLVRVTIH